MAVKSFARRARLLYVIMLSSLAVIVYYCVRAVFSSGPQPCFVDLPDGRRYQVPAQGFDMDSHAEQLRNEHLRLANSASASTKASSSMFRGQKHKQHRNCSVVGNDSSMRNSGWGPAIDAAQTIYRMNFAPVGDYTKDVGSRTYTQCLNPSKLRDLLKQNNEFVMDTGEKPNVVVVGDPGGVDPITGATGPCLEWSPGGHCTRRADNPHVKVMHQEVQSLAERLLATLQIGELEAVPTTGMYCLMLALLECTQVDVFGMGVGTINHKDLSDLEYFKDPSFHGWDGRHDTEMERALLRLLHSGIWTSSLSAGFGRLRWHNPLMGTAGANDALLADIPCTSGIHC